MQQKLVRNFKFWILQTQKTIGMILAFGIGYTFLFDFMMGQELNYMYLMSVVCCFIIPMTTLSAYLPMLISFGSGRREAALGFQIMNVLGMLEMLLANYLFLLVCKDFNIFEKNTMLLTFLSFLLCVGIGQCLGCVTLKYGVKASVVVLLIICFSVVAGAIYGLNSDALQNIIFDIKNVWGVILIIVGIVIYIVSIVILLKIMKKYEVKNVS